MFLIIAIIFFLGAPIARAIARSIERHGLQNVASPDPELRRLLTAAEQRLSDSETRIAALEERVDFYEKLLAAPKKTD